MLAAYAQDPGAYHQAQDDFGGPQGLLRSAAAAIEQSGPDDPGKSPGAAGDDETQALSQFASSTGLWLDPTGIRDFMATHAMRSGSEHKVAHFLSQNRVVKDLDVQAVATESLFDYLTDHLLSNYLFQDSIHLEGFYLYDERLHIVVSQPFVEGVHPPWAALKEGLEARGLHHESPNSLIPSFTVGDSLNCHLCINDLHENNVILDTNGELHPIDAHFYFNTRAERVEALTNLGLWPTASPSE